MKKVFVSLAIFIAYAATSTNTAYASLTLDQQNYVDPNFNGTNAPITYTPADTSASRAQTFTVGLTGSLTRLDILMYQRNSQAYARLDILKTIGGVPSNNAADILATKYIYQVPDYPTYSSFSFNVPVYTGEQLAFVVSSLYDYSNALSIIGTSNNTSTGPYTKGSFLSYAPNYISGWYLDDAIGSGHFDLAFSTYVDTTPTPIPPAFLLMGSGLIGLLGFKRSKIIS